MRSEIWHKDYNLDHKDNLRDLPAASAVFGIFAIVNEEPVNCRHIGLTGNLKDTVKALFENAGEAGLIRFMQGPFIKMLQYELLPDSSDTSGAKIENEWRERYSPRIDEDGEYPGYYEF